MIGAQLEPSDGDIDLHGVSVRYDATVARTHLGICPQHDILLPDLTAREHLALYGSLTGMTSDECTRCIPELLHQVRLDGTLADRPAGHFSGGMQRRLSVAAAFIGNPIGSTRGHQKVVMLDEPTTGMDPMNRKHVWDLVKVAKRDCTVVLTTHSMEEADALGDRIGIMSSGSLVALGTSLHLKTKYGGGFRVSLVASPTSAPVIRKAASAKLGREPVEEAAGATIFTLPDQAAMARAPALFEYIEAIQSNAQPGIELTDWGISHTTLEDVQSRSSNPARVAALSAVDV